MTLRCSNFYNCCRTRSLFADFLIFGSDITFQQRPSSRTGLHGKRKANQYLNCGRRKSANPDPDCDPALSSSEELLSRAASIQTSAHIYASPPGRASFSEGRACACFSYRSNKSSLKGYRIGVKITLSNFTPYNFTWHKLYCATAFAEERLFCLCPKLV